MVGTCSEWFWSSNQYRTALIFLLVLGVIPSKALFSQTTVEYENHLALAPGEKKSRTNKQDERKPDRPPEVKILSTIEDGGGYGQELHRITITGIARNASGDPIKDADIYISNFAMVTPGDFERLRGHTKSDELGFFELKDIQLIVARQRPNPIPKPAEGTFTVFGTKDGYGFTWHESRVYRPDTRPQGIENGDKNEQATARAFYLNEPIAVDLIFERPAKLKGRITDKQGQPLANAKVQIGLVDNLRSRNRWGSWSCRFLGNENHPVDEPIPFDGILTLPAEFRETRTDKNGEYEFTQLRRDTSYLSKIDPGPTFDPWQFRLATTTKNRARRGMTAVGYDGELNHEFDSPRSVTVQVVQEKTEQPVANVQLTAHPVGQIRRAGIQARSDSQGNANLQLLPGEYTLIAEPASDQPFYFQSEQFIVTDQSKTVQHTVKLRPAAIVILKAVNADTGEPIPGVRFNYETHDSSEQLPVSTQSVFVDYPSTNAAGEIQAFMVPGMRRFVVTEPLTLAQADGSRGERVKLTGGELTEVVFELAQPQFLPSHLADQDPTPDPNSIYPTDLQLKWHKQSELLRHSHLRVNMDMILVSRQPVDTAALLKDLRSLDPDQLPDVDQLLKKYQVENSFRSNTTLTSSGKLRSELRYHQTGNHFYREDNTRLPDSASFTDQWDTLHYSTTNNQASVSRRGVNGGYLHIASPDEFSDWPSLPTRRPASSKSKKPEVNIRQTGQQTIYEGQTEKYTHRRVIDRETGFIFENYAEYPKYGVQRVSLFFAPQTHANGLILPRLYISWNLRKDKLSLLKIYEINQVEVFSQLPADAFAIPLPSGAMIVDSRHIPPRASRTGPMRPFQTTMRGPISDFAAYLQRHPRHSHQVEQKIHYGRRAPELKPAKWVTNKGESDVPDLKGKVVLIEFWGTRCGPCIGQLPEVRTAARYYADQPFVLIGMHDSHISVADLQKFAEKENLEYQLAIDRPATKKGWFGQTMQNFGIRGIPQAAVIDQQGKVAFVGSFKEALSTVDRLLKPETKP